MKHHNYFAIAACLICLSISASYGQSPSENAPLAARDDWDIAQTHGKRLGFAHTTIKPETVNGQPIVVIEQTTHFALERAGQATSFDVTYKEKQSVDGDLQTAALEIKQGPTPQKIEAKATDKGRLIIHEYPNGPNGKEIFSLLEWPKGASGLLGPELSLLRHPMKPGEHLVIKHFDIGNLITTTDMTAVGEEMTKLPTGTFPLLRIDVVDTMTPEQKLERKLWVDHSGNVMKSWIKLLDMEAYRVSEAVATAKTELPKLDLLQETLVKVDRPIENAHSVHRIRYQVHLGDDNPCKVFVSSQSQQVKAIDDHTAEITVYALRPGDKNGNAAANDAPPTDDDRKPNGFIQSDDPLIVGNAEKAAGGVTNPWKVALLLEKYVNKAVDKKDFSQAFATASDVARSHEGDCTEHAVYLAALARAEGIPARVAIGLVYMQGSQTFGYHMWTEVFIDKRWIPIDATLARGGIGGGHLMVATSSLAGSSAYSSFLPVAQVIGKLSVKVLEVDE